MPTAQSTRAPAAAAAQPPASTHRCCPGTRAPETCPSRCTRDPHKQPAPAPPAAPPASSYRRRSCLAPNAPPRRPRLVQLTRRAIRTRDQARLPAAASSSTLPHAPPSRHHPPHGRNPARCSTPCSSSTRTSSRSVWPNSAACRAAVSSEIARSPASSGPPGSPKMPRPVPPETRAHRSPYSSRERSGSAASTSHRRPAAPAPRLRVPQLSARHAQTALIPKARLPVPSNPFRRGGSIVIMRRF